MIKFESNSISCRMKNLSFKDAFRINWQLAVKEAEDNLNKTLLNGNFDLRLKAADLLYEVKYMYSKDDVDGYLELLDKNRDVLKGVVLS